MAERAGVEALGLAVEAATAPVPRVVVAVAVEAAVEAAVAMESFGVEVAMGLLQWPWRRHYRMRLRPQSSSSVA